MIDSVQRRSLKTTGALLVILLFIWPLCRWTFSVGGDYLHLALAYPYYVTEISHNTGKPTSFDWDEGSVTGSVQSKRTLVYDPTGEAASRVGRVRLSNEQRIICKTKHLVGHSYVAETSW